MDNKRKILLIGGSGYIGTVVTSYFLDNGIHVRSFDNYIYKHGSVIIPFLHNPLFEQYYGDILDQSKLENALKNVSDVVILAGLVGDPITKKYPNLSEKINLVGLKKCIEVIKKKPIERLIFVSTCSNYGLINKDIKAKEDYELNPLSLYAKAKVEIEKYILDSEKKDKFSPTVLRFATAFGLSPRMRFDLTVNQFAREITLGNELIVYDADTWRPYCHVQDFAFLIKKVLNSPAQKVSYQVFNAGGDKNNFTKQGIINELIKFYPNANVVYKDAGSDPRNYKVDFSKVNKILGFTPKYSVVDGIIEIINAIKVHALDDVDKNYNFYGNYEIKKQ